MLRKINLKLILILFLSLFIGINHINAKENTVNIYLIHSKKCPHCKEEIKFLNLVKNNYHYINIYKYEISKEETTELLNEIEKIYKVELKGVPITIIGNTIYNGYSEQNNIKYLKTIEYYRKYNYNDKLANYLNISSKTNQGIKNNISLKKYLKSSILDNNFLLPILSVLSNLTINNIIISILLIILLSKITIIKEKIYLLSSYYLILILLTINNIIYSKVNIISIIIYIILLLIIIYNYLKRKKYLYIIFLPIINKVLELFIVNKYLNTLTNNAKYELTTINKVIYYITYFTIYIILNILLLIIIIKIKEYINNLLHVKNIEK